MSYICANCGFGSESWLGKCPDCGQWNTFEAQQELSSSKNKSSEPTQKLVLTPLKKITSLHKNRIKTGVFELDRVLGGGFIHGEVILLTGEPGVGKSTLLLQSLQNIKTLYISGEESAEQVKDRADRLGIHLDKLLFSETLQVEGILEGIKTLKDVDVIVIDSIQTIYSKKIDSSQGTISQLKESSSQLISYVKKAKKLLLLIGHITKEGDIAGPKTLEHIVDCVLNFEGERISNFRLLRASKNRFGPTDEIGIFEMRPSGLHEVTNPLIFLQDQDINAPGKAIIGVTEGKRPLFFEIQTLASQTFFPIPRRVVKGIDYNKTLLLLAVVKKLLGIPIDKYDMYVNIVGGVTIKSTGADLGFIASLISSIKNVSLSSSTLFLGEVGLLGEVRPIPFQNKILHEAKRLGFKTIYSSENVKNIKSLRNILKI
jgi:DNA repair protein RadA/Sms